MRILVVLILLMLVLPTEASSRGTAAGRETARIGKLSLTVFTYRPPGCRPEAILFVFHGTNRNAAAYRDNARPLADRMCLDVIAPLFDRKRFTSWRYQRGGIVRKGKVLPARRWTVTLVRRLVMWARQRAKRPAMPVYLFGHSAGGQFLSRVAAFAPPPDAARIVIANPSSHVLPSLEEAAPYGLDGAFSDAEAEARLRRYLSLPVTIYLGERDTGRKNLLDNAAARRQGANRFERGRNVYRAAVALARRKGWPCNWALVTVPRVGHSSRRMLSAPQALEAFGLSPADTGRLR